jgi:hypothetical protein
MESQCVLTASLNSLARASGKKILPPVISIRRRDPAIVFSSQYDHFRSKKMSSVPHATAALVRTSPSLLV